MKEILIGVVSSIIGGLIVFIVSSSLGLYEKVLTDRQVEAVTRSFVDDKDSMNTLLNKMAKDGKFKGDEGEVGPKGPEGPVGPAGPPVHLECKSINTKGRIARCPSNYIVTGCSAGGNRGSYNLLDNYCETHSPDTDWTTARCCTLKPN